MPDRLCVELKSLKLYLQAFRQRGIYYEHVTNVILDDLVAALRPRRITVEGEFNVRGGIYTTVVAEHVSWVSGAPPAPGTNLTAQVRYRSSPLPCDLDLHADGRIRVSFRDQRPEGVAAGQAVVLYAGDECLGGATITCSQ